ncbi:NAD(P)-dependent alcohol dehydrogenase [Mastigocoleus sp. MO_188.B34]|uniref:NAD(P)-dependent alcohol dehydrogenase n=1 Tax=Mastigocoleus sp. MO_188.B34 TaxID=3036635 RepID=UPI002611454E|nr:NAD(P)-dependent alcohol dehydrogenase [Mastigocoleus sp. MO_188.B34]MDJ0694585.1 NAD(P)-dependent alcohol dehydrogenase [Mastigocoleus sp. MO_188.B34]
MKAIIYTQYGSPDVLQLKEIPKPFPGNDEVLVKIDAAAANPLDWHFMRASPFIIRFISGLLKPKNQILGADIAGQIEAIGTNIKNFQAGDKVYGEISRGGFAEYVCVTEDKLVLKPVNLSFEKAAAVPVAGLTALQCLRDQGHVQPEQKVLINGASGGVGTFAVQIAKSLGAKVTGVCSTQNVDMVRSIGADRVIDYTSEDFTQNDQRYDLILDNVGNRSVSEIKRILASNGTYLLNAYSPALMLQLIFRSGGSKTGGQIMRNTDVTKANQKDLEFLKALLEAGKIVSVIDRVYPLSEVAEAIGYLEEGHARGKVVITLENSNKT